MMFETKSDCNSQNTETDPKPPVVSGLSMLLKSPEEIAELQKPPTQPGLLSIYFNSPENVKNKEFKSSPTTVTHDSSMTSNDFSPVATRLAYSVGSHNFFTGKNDFKNDFLLSMLEKQEDVADGNSASLT